MERVKTSSHSRVLPSVYVNPFPNKPWFLCVGSTSLLKTLWKKEKLLVTVFSICSESFPPFSTNLKLSSANSFSLKFVIWESVKSTCRKILKYCSNIETFLIFLNAGKNCLKRRNCTIFLQCQ